MTKFIVIRTAFEAIHCWPDCPIEEVAFLRDPHRHIFHVEIKWKVQHNDRDKEFIMQKRKVDEYIMRMLDGRDIGRTSCEDLCDSFKQAFPEAVFISVFEDNENGVEAYYE